MCTKEQQPPLTLEEQIDNLRTLGLEINDDEYANHFLNDVSYFRLIKAYSLGLKPKNGIYYENTSFDTIVQLYKFNSKFRQLLFPLIERIEINLRCRIANHFSYKYGVLGYEKSDNFLDEGYHQTFMQELDLELKRNLSSPFVKNFKDNYLDSKIPFYALIELFSFGTLSKFYKNMKNEDKKAIAKSFNVGYTYLESWIESVSFVRNICAHYGRLYNIKLPKAPSLYSEYLKAGIKSYSVFAVLLCIKHLVGASSHWVNFTNALEALIKKYESVEIKKMGFPDKWQDYLS